MLCYFDERQLVHAPAMELHNGAFIPHAESPSRATSILASLGHAEPAVDHGLAPLAAIHSPDYLDFLASAWRDWRESGRPGEAGAYAWPVVGRRPLDLSRIDARLGQYSFDASSPIGPGTWDGAYWAAQTALTALQALIEQQSSTFALCRPPGHHCGADYLGGYCYLNNAAIAAQAAIAAGRRPAIIDVDYHHGNGTQDIFYSRRLPFVSIHADPRTDYPFFWGHGDETGICEGEGANLNLPLAQGATLDNYLPALDTALAWLDTFSPDLLICSFGADTFEGDPISSFLLRTRDFAELGARIAGHGLPTLVVMEGGYAVDALGDNVAAFLSGF